MNATVTTVGRLLRSALPTGAALAVGIGYMDPGNWATDLDAGRYGETLLWSVIAAGVAAMFLQLLAVQVTNVRGADLATLIAARWPQLRAFLWPSYAGMIVATEAAEFTGITVGVALLGGFSVGISMAIAVCIVFALLLVRGTVSRRLEWCAIGTTIVIAGVYAADCASLHPSAMAILAGLRPSLPDNGAVIAVIGIVGATIMPHNLFLHSGLAMDERSASPSGADPTRPGSTLSALSIATLVNAAILVVGASIHAPTIDRAFVALIPAAGPAAAAAFGCALTFAGIASLSTSARAGDVVLHAGAPLHWSPLVRRAAGVAVAVAILLVGVTPATLLVASQVVLGLALPLTVFPLLMLAFSAAKCSLPVRTVFSASIVIAALTLTCDTAALLHLLP